MLFLILLLVIALLVLWFIWENWSTRHRPPGPWRFPLIGTLIQIALADPIPHIALDKMGKKFGNVMSVKMGVMDTIVLSSFDSIKDVLHREETFGRFANGIMLERIENNTSLSLAFSSGEPWEKMRKYCKESLKKYGYGNRIYTETLFQESVEVFMSSTLEKDRNTSPNGIIHFTKPYFYKTFFNVIVTLLSGKSKVWDDEAVKLFLDKSNEFMKSAQMCGGILSAFPILNKIFPKFFEYDKQKETVQIVKDLCQLFLTNARKTKYEYPTNFVEDFNMMIEQDAQSRFPFYTDHQFVLAFSDLLIAGFETSANSISFILLLLASHPEVQEKLYSEIYNVVGTDRKPTLHDRERMIYTQAVILESARWARTVVLLVPRLVLEDFTYKNYQIKKGTAIISNLHTVFFDKGFWGDPEVFRPERFLDSEGKLSHKHSERIIIFGTGKRNCFGETISKDGIFLFTTALIQKYKFELPEDIEKPSLEPVAGFTQGPQPYFAKVTLRD